MDNKYRMAEWFSSDLEQDDLLYFCEDERKAVVHGVNAHDAVQDRIEALEQERDQLIARVFELELGILQAEVCSCTCLTKTPDPKHHDKICRYRKLRELYNKSPAACLATIQAKAIEDFQTYFDKEYYGEDLSQFIESYSEKLRQQAKEQNS